MARVIIASFVLLVAATAFEIGGGYLVWLWKREKFHPLVGVVGGVILFMYGVLQTYQHVPFARAYAAYGSIFIIGSMIFGFVMDRKKPDRLDIIGAVLVFIGMLFIMYIPHA